MTKTINAEVKTTELIDSKDIINIKTVEKNALEQFIQYNAQIQADITDLNLPSLLNNPNEENLSKIKTTRTKIRKEKNADEEKRKAVEKQYNKQLNEWKELYNKYVFNPRNKVDLDLKTAQDSIEDTLRKQKTAIFEKMFKTKKEELKIDFVKFEDVGLNIQLSTAEKQLKDQLNDFFDKVQRDLEVIDTNEESHRILAQYHKHLDLAKAIVDVKAAIELENQLKHKQEQASKQRVEVLEEKTVTNTPKPKPALETFKVSFTVTATKEELLDIKNYLRNRGIKYE